MDLDNLLLKLSSQVKNKTKDKETKKSLNLNDRCCFLSTLTSGIDICCKKMKKNFYPFRKKASSTFKNFYLMSLISYTQYSTKPTHPAHLQHY